MRAASRRTICWSPSAAIRNRVGQTYRLKYNPEHRWFYFPRDAARRGAGVQGLRFGEGRPRALHAAHRRSTTPPRRPARRRARASRRARSRSSERQALLDGSRQAGRPAGAGSRAVGCGRPAEAGIQAILSVNDGLHCHAEDFAAAGVAYACIPLSANAPPRPGDEGICARALPQAYTFVQWHISQGRATLVHCSSGKDRTGTLLLLFPHAARAHGGPGGCRCCAQGATGGAERRRVGGFRAPAAAWELNRMKIVEDEVCAVLDCSQMKMEDGAALRRRRIRHARVRLRGGR